MPIRIHRLFLATVFLVQPASAATDPQTSLSVDPPAPFVAALVTSHPANVAAMITVSLPEADVQCGIVVRAAASNNSLTQAELDAFIVKPEMINLTKASLALAFDLGEPAVFTADGITGLEFVGAFKPGSAQAGTRVYLTSQQTPLGVTMMTCLAPPARFEGLVPQFRTIRDTIKPAR